MNNSRNVSMWNVMSKYSFEEDGITNDDNLTCLLCKKLMKDACQTTCGCRFCYKCICDYLGHGEKCCPGCKREDLNLIMDVMKNTRLNNRICKVRVRCPNEWCQFTIELEEMVDHLANCVKESTQCPYMDIGCDLVNHDNSDGSSHTLLLVGCINNLKNEVYSLKEALDVKNVQLEEMVKTRMEQTKEIEDLVEESQNQEDRIDTLEEESAAKEIRIGNLEGQIIAMKDLIETKFSVAVKKAEKNEIELKKVSVQNAVIIKDVEKMRKENSVVAVRSVQIQKEGMAELFSQNNIKMEKRMLNYIKWAQLCPQGDFDFVWRIGEISRKKNVHKGTKMYSDSFYSREYNFCLSLYIKGDRIALWCYLMKGANDDQLDWPMEHRVTLSILDQKSMESHKSASYQVDSYDFRFRSAFDEPAGNRNDDHIGEFSLCRYSSIVSTPQIIVNDSILVACSVGAHSSNGSSISEDSD